MKFVFITVSAPAIRCLMKAADEISLTENEYLICDYIMLLPVQQKTQRLIDDIGSIWYCRLMGSPAE